MAEPFTREDAGKTVVTAEGDRIGTIGDVEDGRATVESDESDQGNITDSIREMIGWDGSGDARELEGDEVDRNEDNQVVLPTPT
jgi:hypothetical protein